MNINNFDLLVLGLGNPESKYLNTRHNIGWNCVINLIKKYAKEIYIIKNIAKYATFKIKNKRILAAVPLTYMNLSGIAAKKLCSKFQISYDKLLVIVDEYNFPVGKIHIKQGGNSGGHNGIASIIEEIETNEFYKLRCGIGHNFSSGELIDYVLSDFNKDEEKEVDFMIEKVIKAIEYFVMFESGRAMSEINSGNLFMPQL